MKTFRMPGGTPLWRDHLEEVPLENLFGFIEARVECPEHIHKPFLPYREKKTEALLFPRGKFVGVYFSEEFKYAKSLGYIIVPIAGDLYEEKKSPFDLLTHATRED